MITQEKLRIYEKHYGDPDSWARVSTPDDRSILSDDDWTLIQRTLDGLYIVQSGRATSEFETRVREQARHVAADESVYEGFLQLAQPKN